MFYVSYSLLIFDIPVLQGVGTAEASALQPA